MLPEEASGPERPVITTWPRWASVCRPRGPPPRPGARPSTRARAGCTWPPSRRRNAGTTGWSCPPGPGRRARSSTTCWSPRPASTASPPAGCWPTWTATTWQVRKFEGNPEHPGSRGRNCAKGPATLNQVTDPDRILYPLKRAGRARRRPVGAGQLGRGARRAGRRGSGRRSSRTGSNEIMVHVGRPGEDGFTERVLASWGVDGHNSHTNVCSSGGRTGFQFWMGIDRPSPDHAQRQGHLPDQRPPGDRALLQPARPADHRGQAERRQADRAGHPAVQHRHRTPTSGCRRSPAARPRSTWPSRSHLIRTGRYDRRVRAPLVELGGVPRRVPPGHAGHLRGVRGSPGRAVRRVHLRVRGGRVRPGRRGASREVAEIVAGAGTRFACHAWRSAAAGQPRRLAGVPDPVPDLRAARRGGHRGRHLPQRVEQVRAAADPRAAAPGRVAGAVLAAGVPAGPERDVVPAAALPEGGPRQAGHLLHPRLQPGVDQPGRAELDGGPHRRGEGRAASSR